MSESQALKDLAVAEAEAERRVQEATDKVRRWQQALWAAAYDAAAARARRDEILRAAGDVSSAKEPVTGLHGRSRR